MSHPIMRLIILLSLFVTPLLVKSDLITSRTIDDYITLQPLNNETIILSGAGDASPLDINYAVKADRSCDLYILQDQILIVRDTFNGLNTGTLTLHVNHTYRLILHNPSGDHALVLEYNVLFYALFHGPSPTLILLLVLVLLCGAIAFGVAFTRWRILVMKYERYKEIQIRISERSNLVPRTELKSVDEL